MSVFVRKEDRPPVPQGMLAVGQLAAAIDTEESVLRGLGGEHDLCPQVKGRGVLESEADAASHLETSESDSPMKGVWTGRMRRNWGIISWGKGKMGEECFSPL